MRLPRLMPEIKEDSLGILGFPRKQVSHAIHRGNPISNLNVLLMPWDSLPRPSFHQLRPINSHRNLWNIALNTLPCMKLIPSIGFAET